MSFRRTPAYQRRFFSCNCRDYRPCIGFNARPVLTLCRGWHLATLFGHCVCGRLQDLMKRLAEQWRNLSPEEKLPFEEQAKEQKEKYRVEKAAYDLEHGASPIPVFS